MVYEGVHQRIYPRIYQRPTDLKSCDGIAEDLFLPCPVSLAVPRSGRSPLARGARRHRAVDGGIPETNEEVTYVVGLIWHRVEYGVRCPGP